MQDKTIDDIDREIDMIKSQKQKIDNYWQYKKTFQYIFLNKHEQRMFFVRNHLGSYMALAMACHNTYNLKQQIIKNSIAITKSTNPFVVKMFCLPVGLLYFTSLTLLWHIPSYTAEVSYRLYTTVQTLIGLHFLPLEKIIDQVGLDKLENHF